MPKTTKEDKAKERRERGQTYLTELLALVPEEDRAAVEAKVQNDVVLDHLGENLLRQSDYSRSMNELKKSKEALAADVTKYQGAYDDNIRWRQSEVAGITDMKSKLARYEKMLAPDALLDDGAGAGVKDPGSNGDVDLSKYITREDADKALQERLEQTERNGIQLMSMISNIQARHLKQFNEALDAQDLFEHAAKTKMTLPAAYKDFISERVEEDRKKDHEKEIVQAREDGRIEALRNPTLPHVVNNNEPTVLDALATKDRSAFGLKPAIDDYYKMLAEKNATP